MIVKEKSGEQRSCDEIPKGSSKPWREVTAREIKKNKEKYCMKCIYSRSTGGGRTLDHDEVICMYTDIKHKVRNCSPIDCVEFTPKKRTRRKKG